MSATEIALASIRCESCGSRVVLGIRYEGEPGKRRPVYVPTDGQHELNNSQAMGRKYPIVTVARCNNGPSA